jgi:diguanylate cyclase (GGDEF)-like protein
VVVISLFNRARATRGRTRLIWLGLDAAAAGCGIWATHFIAMLAYQPGFTAGYDAAITGFSLLIAVVISGTGLAIALQNSFRWSPALGGAILGTGIAAMHFTGMSALEVPARLNWSPSLVTLAVAFGIVLGSAAIFVAARRNDFRSVLDRSVFAHTGYRLRSFYGDGRARNYPGSGKIDRCSFHFVGVSRTCNRRGRIRHFGHVPHCGAVDRPMTGGGWVATFEDITEWRKAEEKISHMARHDPLTDLPNRTLFHEQMERALRRTRRDGQIAVLCLDLDHFKDINDTLGHPTGDHLLKAVAERLGQAIRETDTLARLGGDEFAIVQVEANDQPAQSAALASRLVDVISAPYDINGHHVVIGTSIGVSIAPTDGTDPDQLLKNADMALYRAKADGRGTYRFFEDDMDACAQSRRTLELDLRAAVACGQFEAVLSAHSNHWYRRNHRIRGSCPMEPSHSRHDPAA